MLVVDCITGKTTVVEIFVTTLVDSQFTYVEASANQRSENFLAGKERALRFMGGAPRAIVPDNLKSAVTRPDRYESMAQEQFADFSGHFGTYILPARVARPEDKALVEKSMNYVYSRIYARLRDRTFYSVAELNQAIREPLEWLNRTKFRNRGTAARICLKTPTSQPLGSCRQRTTD